MHKSMLTIMIQNNSFERYTRQLPIDGWGEEGQEKLKNATVVIAGAGGLGGPAACYLAAAGVGRIKIVDSDRVELSNLNRQILHSENTLGQLKVDSAKERLKDFNSTIEIEPFPVRITDENIHEIAEGCSLLVDCFDSFSSRMVLNRYAVRKNLPLVHGGIREMGGQLTVVPRGGRPCLECLFAGVKDQKNIPVLGAAAGIIGSMEAMEAIKLITGIGQPLTGKLLICNGLFQDYSEISFQRNPDCPVCGSGAQS